MVCSAAVTAGNPIRLSDEALDRVSGGDVEVTILAQAKGKNGVADVLLSSQANSNGAFTLETAVGIGQAFACCKGGKTKVKVGRKGSGKHTGGGAVEANIKILNYGSYSFGIGLQVAISQR
jgi:hypothetical protein